MADTQTLHQILDNLKSPYALGPDVFIKKAPAIINNNLKAGFGQREYQQEAFGRFVHLWEAKQDNSPTQLLYHMATGSGKTLIMAGLIIYLYEKGYRNFLFFVNSTNIIEKTRDNFLNPASSKYLFSDTVSIGDKQIAIKEVDNFEAANQDNINIVFSTIQGLHSRLNTPRENSITYEDFEEKRIVLISDEAHHINAETKKGNQLSNDELFEVVSWENTVYRIFNANKQNILLEFTATADLSNPDIAQKYHEKIIFDYPLKQFRKDGYSKEVKVLQADLPQIERALQAVILNQYRRKVFEKNKKIIKPVILFKSKTIAESKAIFAEFIKSIKELKPETLEKIKGKDENQVISKVFKYFDANGITLENLITELKEDFIDTKCISVNSKEESEEKQIAVNTLEAPDNEYRAVFAVDKLNEGWDVLNLFDIVRLYDTRDAKNGKPGNTTMSEAQLIGRGARYCPFKITEEQPLYQRKFDEDIDNELRICEELYYHSSYNPKYISELNTALEEIGIKAKETKERQMTLKFDFQEKSFYKTAHIFLNKQEKYTHSDVFGFPNTIIEHTFKVSLKTGFVKTSIAFEKQDNTAIERKPKDYFLKDFGQAIIRKALNKLEFYNFNNLIQKLPNVSSISDFITSENYLGKIKLEVEGTEEQINNLTAKDKLDITVNILEQISLSIGSDQIEFKGTKEFKPYMLKDTISDKTLQFAVNESEDKEYGKSMCNPTETSIHLDLSKKDWYVFNDCFGTSEEKYLIKFIDKVYQKLKDKYDEIYLVRNERFFKIYNFADGKPTEPDFVLFLINSKGKEELHYQIFIEPKGKHLLKEDAWKESFLKSLKAEHKIEQLWKGKNYTVWGMPFYNEEVKKTEFEESFNELLV